MNYSANDNLEVMKYAKNYNKFLVNEVISKISEFSYKQILDFGCADGFFMDLVKNAVNSVDIYGVEIDDESLEICKNKNLNVKNNLDELANNFDLIYSFNVLEHIENDSDILLELNKKLAPNGRIIIYVPALMFLFSSMDVKTGHFRRYNKFKLKEKVLNAGFKIEKLEYCDSFGVIATILYKLKDKIVKNSNGNISVTSIKLYDSIFPISRFFDKILFKFLSGKNLIVVARKEN